MKYKKGDFALVPNIEALSTVDACAQAVYLWLCKYADEDGVCYPSITTISDKTQLSRSTVKRKIQTLEENGFIQKTVRFSSDNRQISNLYQLLLGGSQRTGGEVHSELGEGFTVNHKLYQYRTIPETNNPPTPQKEDDDLFEEFWNEYPKKQAKATARRKYRQIDKTTHGMVMSGLRKWKQTSQWKKDNGKYIPMPTTFLNQERYLDEIPEVVKEFANFISENT